jgi:heptosyltransferase I
MRVLIVRLSSMGDVVQTLPALTDATRAKPDARFDWAVAEPFAQIPAWHAGVDRVIPTALHRWGRNPLQSASGEFKSFLKELRRRRYDAVVDLQGEMKSAFITKLAKGVRYGHDAASVHERGAQLAYRKKFSIANDAHSIERMRQLLAQSLSYSYEPLKLDYGIERSRLPAQMLAIPQPYLVFLHATSWTSKNWPEEYWRELTNKAVSAGFHIVLPWGDEAERERALRIAQKNDSVIVLPQLSIADKASIIAGATATVGLDTGLSHIAAALSVPSVTLYGATDPAECGAIGAHQVHIASDFECVKCHENRCAYGESLRDEPACFVGLKPDRVWHELETLIEKTNAGAGELYQLV